MPTNLEIVKNAYAGGPPALLGALDGDVLWTEAAGFPYGGTYKGVDDIVKNVFSRLGTEWDGFRVDVDGFHDAGNTIIVTGFYRGAYRETGKSMEASFAHVLTLEGGKVVRFVQYVDSKKVWDAMGKG
jgi:uncharacterized protein